MRSLGPNWFLVSVFLDFELAFWIGFLASLLNRKLSVCEQSEFGAALGVARLSMSQDSNIKNKEQIIKEIKISKNYKPIEGKIDLLLKRYEIWKDIYKRNSNISKKLIF